MRHASEAPTDDGTNAADSRRVALRAELEAATKSARLHANGVPYALHADARVVVALREAWQCVLAAVHNAPHAEYPLGTTWLGMPISDEPPSASRRTLGPAAHRLLWRKAWLVVKAMKGDAQLDPRACMRAIASDWMDSGAAHMGAGKYTEAAFRQAILELGNVHGCVSSEEYIEWCQRVGRRVTRYTGKGRDLLEGGMIDLSKLEWRSDAALLGAVRCAVPVCEADLSDLRARARTHSAPKIGNSGGASTAQQHVQQRWYATAVGVGADASGGVGGRASVGDAGGGATLAAARDRLFAPHRAEWKAAFGYDEALAAQLTAAARHARQLATAGRPRCVHGYPNVRPHRPPPAIVRPATHSLMRRTHSAPALQPAHVRARRVLDAEIIFHLDMHTRIRIRAAPDGPSGTAAYLSGTPVRCK